MHDSYELKPNKTAFVTYSFLRQFIFSLLVAAIIAIALSATLNYAAALILALVYVLLQLLAYYSLTVRYGKEKYIFLKDRIVRKSGGIFSNRETELIVRNITYIKMNLPFVEHRLFGTGSISIQSAGSGGVEIKISSVDNPEKFYEYVENFMKTNGFSLTKKNLVQREKPSSLGVFFEVFKRFLTFLIAFVYFFPSAAFGIVFLSKLGSGYVATVIFLAGVLFAIVFGSALLKFLDLKRRVYEIYSDTITYSEGFLSKNYAFIPMENLSDSEVRQTFVDRVFGLYDVKISCQGAGSEILFKNMRNGHELESNIDRLISQVKPLVGKPRHSASAISVAEKQQPPARKQASLNPEYLAEFRMQMFRTLASTLIMSSAGFFFIILAIILSGFFIKSSGTIFALAGFGVTALIMLIPVAVISLLSRVIRVASTRYLVKKESVEERYDFLTSKHKEFTNEKIMAIVFKESFIDKWFNTCSINFWSIGSAENIKFSNISKSSQLYNGALGKIGIKQGDPIHGISSEFSIGDKLKAEMFPTAFSAILCSGFLIAGFVIHFAFIIALLAFLALFFVYAAYQNAYYKRSKLAFYKDFVHFRKGIFFEEFYYVPNENVKGITTVKYPFSVNGSVTFDVAGEQTTEVRTKNNKTAVFISNNFRISYVHGITTKDDFIDLIFYRKPTSAATVEKIRHYVSQGVQKPLLVSKQAVANTLVAFTIIFALASVILAPFLFFSFVNLELSLQLAAFAVTATEAFLFFVVVILPAIVVKARSYIVEPYRLIAKSGIIYKTQKSILLGKIDHINLIHGMLNKMFNNGTIAVNTIGSSKTEIYIRDITDSEKFYKLLQQRY